jgi:hypothetical protein
MSRRQDRDKIVSDFQAGGEKQEKASDPKDMAANPKADAKKDQNITFDFVNMPDWMKPVLNGNKVLNQPSGNIPIMSKNL